MNKNEVSIYKEKSDELRRMALSSGIQAKTPFLVEAATGNRVDLKNAEAVKKRAFKYLEACEKSGAYPTVLGLSAAFGLSRQWVNKFMRDNPNSEAAQFLEAVKVCFADILLDATLKRNVSEAGGIFAMKNMADFTDKVEITPVTDSNPLGDIPDIEEFKRRIEASVVLDDIDE